MQAARFDEISMVAATRSRRAACRTIAGLTLGGTLGALGREHPASAKCQEQWSERKIKRYIRRAAKKYKQSYRKMLCVAKCESNLTACAVGGSGQSKTYGLFQFLPSTWEWTPYHKKTIRNPRYNALAAAWMWKWYKPADHWSCYGKGYCNFG